MPIAVPFRTEEARPDATRRRGVARVTAGTIATIIGLPLGVALLALALGAGDGHAQAADERPADTTAAADNAATEKAAAEAEAALTIRRTATEAELRAIAASLSAAAGKAEALEKSIAGIERTRAVLREAIVQSATRRKELETRIAQHERKIAQLGESEGRIKASLKERRGLLAEVLAALQRMGRNPPPALLVTPDDALSSVRSAILLGAVVPGIRTETEKLAGDLATLSRVSAELGSEKEGFVETLSAQIEESRRMDRLIIENDRLAARNAEELASERKRAADLASRATSLEGLIVSLERDIDSAREAAEAARAEELKRRGLSPEERERARALAESGVPDKNRIAPAYAFSDLTGKLELPVAGSVIRQFGDDDGTGHTTAGLTLEAEPGAVVTAPADGWIVFAGPFRSYGETVILNPGDGFHMVLTGMGSSLARQGQFVVAGEPLGQMGEKRVASAAALALETDRPTLYIELRKDGKPVDSKPWWLVRTLGKARNDT